MVQRRPGRRELASSHHVARYCRRRDIRNNGALAPFAVLNVGDATDACRAQLNRNIQFTALDEPHDPSHTGIFGYTMDDTDTAAAPSQNGSRSPPGRRLITQIQYLFPP